MKKSLQIIWFPGRDDSGAKLQELAGEIDLIGMTADGWLIFVEVKYRSSESLRKSAGSSERQKAAVISKVAVEYLKNHYRSMDVRCRFDVVESTAIRSVG